MPGPLSPLSTHGADSSLQVCVNSAEAGPLSLLRLFQDNEFYKYSFYIRKSFISYLLIHNNLMPKLGLNQYLLSHTVSTGQEFGRSLATCL